jgi:hypothetical protein
MIAIDVGAFSIGPTPLAILTAVLVLALIVVVVIVVSSQVAGRLVDRRWPANEPLTPTEVLWGEASGYVQKHFPGLDPDIARDLTPYLETSKLGPAATIVEAGDLPSHFYVLRTGAAEIVRGDTVTPLKAGAAIGADEIIRRTPFAATVRTTAPSEIVRLPAEDYLAALALGMDDADDDDVVHLLGVHHAPVTGTTAVATAPLAPPSAPSTTGRAWPMATHRIVVAAAPAYVLPAGDRPSRELPGGTEVRLVEGLPGWLHVDTADGWRGWIESSTAAELGPG